MQRHCLCFAFFAALTVTATANAAAAVDLTSLHVPEGFVIAVYADNVPDARQMALGDDGTLFVGSRRDRFVYALRDTDADGKPDLRQNVGRGMRMPSGLAFKDGALYVAALNEVYRFDDIEQRLWHGAGTTRGIGGTLITDQLPDASFHGWKYLRFAPDGALFVPVGAPCNICLSRDPRFASILRMDPVTGATTVYAHGVRNSVGFDFQPGTGKLWFTSNGRDMMGDDVPPDELNRADRAGMHFGYPFFHGGDIADPKFGKGRNASDYVPPVLKIQAHSAAIGMTFYRGGQFPDKYRGAIFIAEHGSWNRSSKVGYRVSVAYVDGDQVTGYEPFVTGWLHDERAWGRPTDVMNMPDGSLLIADDQAGVIYRVSYRGKR